MKIELMIYVYIAICISMISYNIIYVFVLSHREKKLTSDSKDFEVIIYDEINKIKIGNPVCEKHKRFLARELDKTSGMTAFDKALENIYQIEPETTQKYLIETFSVFEYLTERYMAKDTIKIAYFPYILHKYNILEHNESKRQIDALFELLRSVNVYCRENTIKAIYTMQNPDMVTSALKVLDKNLSFHHPKLVCDGLLAYTGDKNILKEKLLHSFNEYSVQMRLNILNYFRFGNIRCDSEMLEILKDEKENNELRFSAIRYFEKFPNDDARCVLQSIAENSQNRTWEYQAIATSALKAYPDDVTFKILVKNLSSSNWHIRHNSAVSCEKLGYSYYDLISVFDGNDRYAREMMRYHLDRRKQAEETAVKI